MYREKDNELLESLKEYLSYDAETGKFTWIKKPSIGVSIGDEAGGKSLNGYVQICLHGKSYYAHRLAYLFMEGRWPKNILDHVDGDKTNNTWVNIRESTKSGNAQNMRATKSTGAHYFKRDGRWMSSICKDGKKYHLGYYDTQEEAHQAYVMAKKELHEFQPTPRYVQGEINQ